MRHSCSLFIVVYTATSQRESGGWNSPWWGHPTWSVCLGVHGDDRFRRQEHLGWKRWPEMFIHPYSHLHPRQQHYRISLCRHTYMKVIHSTLIHILFISWNLLRLHTANYSRVGSFLTKYGTNLNKVANEGKLDPVIGRQEEIERYATYPICTLFPASHMPLYESWYENGFRALRAIQILGKRTKNNPILIGEPGVGMQAIVHYELFPLLSPSLSYWNWNRQDCDCGRYC